MSDIPQNADGDVNPNSADPVESQSAIEEIPEPKELAATVLEAIKELPVEQQEPVQQAVSSLLRITERYRGPIPHPRILKGYEELAPGSAAEIIGSVKEENTHRHIMEHKVTNADILLQVFAMSIAFIVTMTALVIGGLLISAGKDIAGLALVIGELTALAGGFLYFQNARKEEGKKADDDDKSKPD